MSLARRIIAAEKLVSRRTTADAKSRREQEWDRMLTAMSDEELDLLVRCFTDDGQWIGASDLSEEEAERVCDAALRTEPDEQGFREMGISASEYLNHHCGMENAT